MVLKSKYDVRVVVISVLYLATIKCCKIDCEQLEIIPASWSVKEQDVPSVVLSCTVTGSCHIDLEHQILNWTKLDISTTDFYSLDLFLNCSSLKDKLDFSKTDMKNRNLITAIRVENCNLTWSDLDYMSAEVYLMHLHILMKSQFWDLQPSDPLVNNLTGLYQLEIHIEDPIQPVPFNEIVPTNLIFTGVASLMLECKMSSDWFGWTICPKNMLNYDAHTIRGIFPNLQTLLLYGAYSLSEERLNFPWTDSLVPVPNGLSFSNFWQQEYTSQYASNVNKSISLRVLGFRNVHVLNISSICPIPREVFKFELYMTPVNSVPHDCFHNTAGLKVIDISRNQLTYFLPETFKGLDQLEYLDLSSNRIANLSSDIFDDLTSLLFIALGNNSLIFIPSGLFKNMRLLKTVILNQNKIISIGHSALPIYSSNLKFIDLRWNNLTKFPVDCIQLPKLQKCDCDHNNITLDDLAEILESYQPIKMHMMLPFGYYKEPHSDFSYGFSHLTDQSTISLRDNPIARLHFNYSWNL